MKSLPSVPYPALLQRIQWVFDPVGYLERGAASNPDLFRTQVAGFGEALFIHHPQAIEQILTKDRTQFTAPGHLNKLVTPLVGNSSVMLLEGQRHRRERKLLMPPFHGERMHSYGLLIGQLVENTLQELTPGQSFTALDLTQKITLQVIIKVVFGLEAGERYEQIIELTRSFLEFNNSPLKASFLFFPLLQQDWGAWSPWGAFLRNRNQLDQLIYAEILDRRQNPAPIEGIFFPY
jgi:unspecific monooxygenase